MSKKDLKYKILTRLTHKYIVVLSKRLVKLPKKALYV